MSKFDRHKVFIFFRFKMSFYFKFFYFHDLKLKTLMIWKSHQYIFTVFRLALKKLCACRSTFFSVDSLSKIDIAERKPLSESDNVSRSYWPTRPIKCNTFLDMKLYKIFSGKIIITIIIYVNLSNKKGRIEIYIVNANNINRYKLLHISVMILTLFEKIFFLISNCLYILSLIF